MCHTIFLIYMRLAKENPRPLNQNSSSSCEKKKKKKPLVTVTP